MPEGINTLAITAAAVFGVTWVFTGGFVPALHAIGTTGLNLGIAGLDGLTAGCQAAAAHLSQVNFAAPVLVP